MDKLEIRDLECFCHHGVIKEENVLGQKFLVSVSLFGDSRPAGNSDDLSFTVDYAEAAHFVNDLMGQKSYRIIETAAETICRELLTKYKLARSVEVTIKKPWAPILLPMDTVAVTVYRQWTKVYAGVGSNIGNRRKYIDDAFAGIRNDRYCRNAYMSELIETAPYGYEDQQNFLNGVICFETLYGPDELLNFFHRLEDEGQRVRDIHWGPRTIDLDILFYGDEIIQKEGLIIPHKEIHLRKFVLEPLQEIAPYFVHPVFAKTVTQLLTELEDSSRQE